MSMAQVNLLSSPEQVLIGDHFYLTYELDYSENSIESIHWNTGLIEAHSDIVLIESRTERRESKWVKKLTLSVFDTGKVVLPPLEAEIYKKDGSIEKFKSPEHSMQVFLPGTLHPDLQPIKDIIEDAAPSFLWLYFTMAFLVLLLILLIWWWVRKRKKNQLFLEPKADFSTIDPEGWALMQIQELRKTNWLDSVGEGTYFTRLSFIFRNWLKNRYTFKAVEMTGSELLQELNKRQIYSPAELSALGEIVEKIEYIKYAKGKVEEDFIAFSTDYFEDLIKKKKQELESQKEETDDGD